MTNTSSTIALWELADCKNIPPSSCNQSIPCAGASRAGICKLEWIHLSEYCTSDTPGRVEDDCQIECGLCAGGENCYSY